MEPLLSVERIQNILRREPVDRIGLFEHFWGDTEKEWTTQGHLQPGESLADHFGYDLELSWGFNMTAQLDFEPEILEETEDTVLVRDGNGAVLRRHKQHDATPEHVDFLVQDRSGWEEHIKPYLSPDPARIDFDSYRDTKARAAAARRFFGLSGTQVFEMMHPVCGHEYMLMGMATDPKWIAEMATTYSELTIALMEILFEREGLPDGVWFYEDLGMKERPFISLPMYSDLIYPAHRRVFDFAHSLGLPVIMHSCGFVEPLVPGFIDAGIDCLQVIEVKAGMDLLRLHREFGDRLSFMGGIDVRTLYGNDREQVDRELESKIPRVKEGYGYVLHSDHSVPNQVSYDTYRYFVDRGLELGTYRAAYEGGHHGNHFEESRPVY
jgi:uroporphyrinogen decarboxylase